MAGCVINSRIASKTTRNLASYFCSSASSLLARSVLDCGAVQPDECTSYVGEDVEAAALTISLQETEANQCEAARTGLLDCLDAADCEAVRAVTAYPDQRSTYASACAALLAELDAA